MFWSPETLKQAYKETLMEAKNLRDDCLSRVSAVTLGAILNLYFLDAWVIFACYAFYVVAEVVQRRQFNAFEIEQSWRQYVFIQLNTFMGGLAFALPAAFLWFQGDIGARMIGLCTLFGGLVHVALIRASHIPMGVATILPTVLILLAMPIDALTRGEGAISFTTAFITVLVLLGYFISALLGNNRTKHDLVLASEAAQAANAAKSQFLASISHEVRTPLNGILGVTQAIEADPDHPDTRERAQVLSQSARSLRLIVDDLLDLSKIEAGRMELRPVRADLTDEISAVLDLQRVSAEEKGLHLILEIDAETPGQGNFDALRVRQCLSNLVSNAIKFTSDGAITVNVNVADANQKGCLVEVRVRDTGAGIPADKLATLFSRFTQIDSESTRGIKGTGLGLAITKQFATLMGGTAWASSEIDKGSTFCFSFWVADAAKERLEGAREPRLVMPQKTMLAKPSGWQVLVVDDTPTNRFVTRLLLEAEGYHILEAESATEALSILDRTHVDLILMDIRMPRIDGVTAFKMIRASGKPWQDIPVVALTADAMAEQRDHYLAQGMSGYVAKPIERELLLGELTRLLGDDAEDERRQAAM